MEKAKRAARYTNHCGCHVDVFDNDYTRFTKFAYCPQHEIGPNAYRLLSELLAAYTSGRNMHQQGELWNKTLNLVLDGEQEE